jgi:hypothetical protein
MNQIFTAMLKLPLNAFLGSMDAFMNSMRGFQNVYEQQFDQITADALSHPEAMNSKGTTVVKNKAQAEPESDCQFWSECKCEKCCGQRDSPCSVLTQEISHNQSLSQTMEKQMSRRNECEGVQLISYKISFVKENLEAVLLRDGEDIIDDASDCGTSFEVWKTAEFVQTLHEKNPPTPGKRPSKWIKNSYPPVRYRTDEHGNPAAEGLYYNGIPEEDKKFLRFYHEVLANYQRESTNYQESQAKALQSIEQTLKERL